MKWSSVAAVGALALALSAGMIKATSTPAFCSRCHEMKPEYATWAASAHSKVPCVKCHMEPGAVSFLKAKLNGLKQVFTHVTGGVERPIRLPETISNTVCEACHSSERETTPSGDLKIPHGKHLENGLVRCADCHRLVAHAGVADRGAVEIDEAFLAALARAAPKEFRPVMPRCVRCHFEEKAGYRCGDCHQGSKSPESHPEKVRGLESFWR